MKKLKNGRFSRSIIFATLITTVLTCCVIGGFARYGTSLFGTDAVKVAKWDVSVDYSTAATNFTLEDVDGKRTAEYSFTVISESEVALSYDIVVTLPTALPNPDCVSFTIGGKSQSSISEGRIYTFLEVGEFDANGGSREHILKIEVTDFCYAVAQSGITVEVVARQASPQGGV